MFVDSHCHLSFPELSGRVEEIREAMAQSNVDAALCICTTLEEFEAVHRLAMTYDNFWATVGVHPDNEDVREPDVAALIGAARLPRVVAIGETGLDYYQMDERKGGRSIADMEWQRQRFRVHIRAARSVGLPLVIHTRAASEDTLAILHDEDATAGGHPATGVFHCFTETREVARAALDMGYYVSFSGIITFKSAAELREVVRMVPLDRMLIETDSPYLAPVPFRGKTNEPSYVPWVARAIAEILGMTEEAVGMATRRNFVRLFSQVESVAS